MYAYDLRRGFSSVLSLDLVQLLFNLLYDMYVGNNEGLTEEDSNILKKI